MGCRAHKPGLPTEGGIGALRGGCFRPVPVSPVGGPAHSPLQVLC